MFKKSYLPLLLCLGATLTMALPSNTSSKPLRVATLEISLTDDLTALGIEPVCITVSEDAGGALNQIGPGYLLKTNPHLRDVPQTGSRQHPNLEALLNCKPDLILAEVARNKPIEASLKKIAPTFMLNSLHINYPQMLENFREVAKITGTTAKAEEILTEQEKIMAATKAKTKPHAAPFLAMNLYPDGTIKTFTDKSYVAQFFSVLGRPYALKSRHGELEQTITVEGLLALNPGAIVILLTDGNTGPLQQIQKNPLWQQLNATKQMHTYIGDRAIWVQSPGILASRGVIDEALHNGFIEDKSIPLSQQPIPPSNHWSSPA